MNSLRLGREFAAQQLPAQDGAVTTPWHEDQLVAFSTVNVLTSLAYPMAGLAAMAAYPGLSAMTALTLLGFASAIYHWTRATWAEHFDYAAILLTFGLPTGVALGLPEWTAFGAALAFSALAWLAWRTKVLVVGVLVLLLLMQAWDTGYALPAFGLLGAGYLASWLDTLKRFSWPRWGHGTWHVLTAVGIVLLYLGVAR